jgi:hypothetical protein
MYTYSNELNGFFGSALKKVKGVIKKTSPTHKLTQATAKKLIKKPKPKKVKKAAVTPQQAAAAAVVTAAAAPAVGNPVALTQAPAVQSSYTPTPDYFGTNPTAIAPMNLPAVSSDSATEQAPKTESSTGQKLLLPGAIIGGGLLLYFVSQAKKRSR